MDNSKQNCVRVYYYACRSDLMAQYGTVRSVAPCVDYVACSSLRSVSAVFSITKSALPPPQSIAVRRQTNLLVVEMYLASALTVVVCLMVFVVFVELLRFFRLLKSACQSIKQSMSVCPSVCVLVTTLLV